ncbi:MAG: tetraacyldisaccharide 4'-kinase [Rhodospirillaceae bacterium TMED8]|nr:tetraacyldisaccharide 4'-kinase [Magnetovibrio sp.]OUT52219.1 MAG: tetraacyldisaccharide 4'-kinase [Rhodospirillaceae bacterium TMED8]|tara:strand:+ start:981 stop:2015 length:1035 start_codon:yes stop_codon:yes gene_type:complete
MKAPEFWKSGSSSMLPSVLAPLSLLYQLGANLYRSNTIPGLKTSAPVICIGNITAGGTGKTPVAIDLGKRIKKIGAKPHFLTRGYGGKTIGPLRVEKCHKAAEMGDEPLLLSRLADTWCSRNRAEAAKMAVKRGAEVLIMDDGLQHTSLHKDFSFLVVDGGFGLGNGRLLPAGPLRETLQAALPRINAVICLGEDVTNILREIPAHIPTLTAVIEAGTAADGLVPQVEPHKVTKVSYLAFTGIGRPEKFYETLIKAGANLADTVSFPDHHPYTTNEILNLKQKAKQLNARLITTEKDIVRLDSKERDDIVSLAMRLRWDDETALDDVLFKIVKGVDDADSAAGP